MNEEEIRGKVLLPYLTDLGFDPSEISLEQSFTIRLGKTRHTIKGRSDILCRRNGKNLFIIELKNDSISLSQDDIDQGISYARALVDNIAPFTIITNGKSTRIFDSISREEITNTKISEQSDYWKNGFTLSADEELRIRYEALKKFVSLSDDNLKLFCRNQVQDRMGPIVGSIESPTSKFVRELYVQRKELQSTFNEFVNSDASSFAIVGTAGVGKTNTMCSLALQSLENKFVFFYNAAIINKSPLEHIAQDLNGVFSSKSESSSVLKKLDELGRFLNKTVLLFLDGIDESVNTSISLELSELALAIRNLDRVKICISCKSNIWKNILIINGTHTHLFEELNKFHNPVPELEKTPGYLLQDFSSDELKEIILLYKDTFGFKGDISESLLKELRNGFFLRIFSEVYSNKQIPETVDDKNLLKVYIQQSLEKTQIGVQPSLRILSKIGKILVNEKYNQLDAFNNNDGIEIENLLEGLNFPLNETLPEDLIARNILTRSNKEDSYNISFYYSKIRDYVICFHSYKLDQLSDPEFYKVIDQFYLNYIGESAMAFYIENACERHKQTFMQFKKDKALAYAKNYNSYLEENFRHSKNLFIPKTNGDIGIVLPTDLLKKDGYALFPLQNESSDKILFENLQDPFSGPFFSSRLGQIGIGTVYGSHSSLMVPNQSMAIQKNIFKQLREIIEKGRLSAYNSDILLLEQVSTIVYYYFKQLGYALKLEDYYLPRFEQIYPIDLHEIQRRLYRFRAFHYYSRNNNIPSSAVNLMVEEAIQNNVDIPKLNIRGDFPPFDELFKIVEILIKKGHSVIERHHLPYPDKTILEARLISQKDNTQHIRDNGCAQYSPEQAKLYIKQFVKHLEVCYKQFVDYHFPTYKDEFSFFKSIPNEYFFYFDESDYLKGGAFGYRPSKSGQTEFHFKEPASWDDAFKKDGVITIRPFSLDSFLHNNNYLDHIKTVDGINTPKVDEFCIIRNWVYKLLKSDMRDLFKKYDEFI